MAVLSRRTFILATAAILAASQRSGAAEYPERPITVIVPASAGGARDVVIRLLSPLMERSLGQPLVIDNRTGGGGTRADRAVARARRAGYTLFFGAPNNFATNQFMSPKVGVVPRGAFSLIPRVVAVPLVLYTNSAVPAK